MVMTSVLLRLASLAALLQGLGHGAAVIRWGPTHGPGEDVVLNALRTHMFAFQGFTRTYWQLFLGYGLFAATNCFIEAAVFWRLAWIAAETPAFTAAIITVFIAANIVYAALCWRFFFWTPLLFDVLVAVLLLGALVSVRSLTGPTSPAV
jgi:hypothetical protein